MNCPSCQADNRANRRFCWSCGTEMVGLPCGDCGFENLAFERFCGECGMPIAPGAARPSPSAPPVAEAERRQLTVMFCDLVGSTAMSGQLDPEELREHIVAFQRACADEIARFDGFVARYMGDGMLVYFGYPVAHEDSAERAVRAGLALVRAVRGLASAQFDPHVRVGIATGRVVVGDVIGTGASEERAVVGETPNLAARLQALAEPDTVVISSRTQRLVADAFAFEDLGQHPLKGFDEPIRAWRAVSVRRGRRHEDGEVSLVGRTFELALLTDRWKAASRGEGQLVELAGGPGSGKSHLLAAFVQQATAASAVLRHSCVSHQRDTALHPILERIAEGAGLELADDATLRSEKLAAWVEGWSRDPADIDGILALFSLGTTPEEQSPQARRSAIVTALDNEIAARLRTGPLQLVFEDVQWADPTTLEFLERQLERVGGRSVLCLVTRRTDFDAPWRAKANHSTLSLGKLDPVAAQELVHAHASELSEEVVQQILGRGDGMPGFLVELIRAVQASGDTSAIPETLYDSLAAQLDRLGDAREVAQTAAVIGRDFSADLLQRMLPEADVASALEVLLDREIVSRIHHESGDGYSFRHALLQEAAYDSLLKKSRRAVHEHVATVLTEQLPDAARAYPTSVARHFERADRPRGAATWYEHAAVRAAGQAAVQESIAHRRRAVELFESVADLEDSEDTRQLAGLLVSLAREARFLNPHEQTAALLDRAEAIASAHDHAEQLSRVHFERGNLYFNMGDAESCAAAHQLALTEARRAGSILAEARALGGMADATFALGDTAGAARAARRCVELALKHGFTRIAALNCGVAAWCEYWELNNEDALDLGAQTVELAKTSGEPRALITGHNVIALAATAVGRLTEAQAALDDLGILAEGTDPLGPISLVFNRHGVARARGTPEEVVPLLEEVLASADPEGMERIIPLSAMLTTLPQDEMDPALDEILTKLRLASMSMLTWPSEETLNGLLARQRWDLLPGAVEVIAGLFEGRVPTRPALWLDAARAAVAWSEAPDDEDAIAAVREVHDRAQGKATQVQQVLAPLLGELSGSVPRASGALGRRAGQG